MKLVTFSIRGGAPRSGALIDDGKAVVDLVATEQANGKQSGSLGSVLGIAEGGQNALDAAYEALKKPSKDATFARDTVKLHAPIPNPPQMRDFLCFEKHLKQAFLAARKVRAQQSPDPAAAMREMEEKKIFNDFSARDEQTKEMAGQLGPGKGKDFDGGNAMGPCLVTSDELKDPYKLTMVVRVNGEEWGRGNSSDMGWKFEDCIAHASRSETLHSGEFIASGTVGNGCGLEHLKFLKSGDVVELEVEGIGTLKNRVLRN
jgi:hypothetical protein